MSTSIMTPTRPRPTAGTIEDIEREDDRRGYEPDDATRQFGDYLLRLVREGDNHATRTGRTAPRTLQEMRLRIARAEASDDDGGRSTPPLDGPTANESDIDDALFGGER